MVNEWIGVEKAGKINCRSRRNGKRAESRALYRGPTDCPLRGQWHVTTGLPVSLSVCVAVPNLNFFTTHNEPHTNRIVAWYRRDYCRWVSLSQFRILLTFLWCQIQSLQQDLQHSRQLFESLYKKLQNDIQRTESLVLHLTQQLQPIVPQKHGSFEASPKSMSAADKQGEQDDEGDKNNRQKEVLKPGLSCPHPKCKDNLYRYDRRDNLARHYTMRQFPRPPTNTWSDL